MTPRALLELFDETAGAVRAAVARTDRVDLRRRTDRPGQYALDLAADEAALAVLHRAPVLVVSEESGESGAPDAAVTVVLDPVDGSTNCARRLSYWATSIAALDGDGLIAGYVVNHATGEVTTAVRGEGTTRDGAPARASGIEEITDAVVAIGNYPAERLHWKQFRAFGCAALTLCDIAAGNLDAYFDTGSHLAPWDYLAGVLACREAGAVVVDGRGEELVTAELEARRQILAAATPALLDAIKPAGGVQ